MAQPVRYSVPGEASVRSVQLAKQVFDIVIGEAEDTVSEIEAASIRQAHRRVEGQPSSPLPSPVPGLGDRLARSCRRTPRSSSHLRQLA